MAGAITSSTLLQAGNLTAPALPVKRIGQKLMQDYVLPLEALGLLLTAAMIGAVIIAMNTRKEAQ